jgi:hypothetical protein
VPTLSTPVHTLLPYDAAVWLETCELGWIRVDWPNWLDTYELGWIPVDWAGWAGSVAMVLIGRKRGNGADWVGLECSAQMLLHPW